MSMAAYELAQIVTDYKMDFLAHHKASAHSLRTLGAIERCRTASLGGHVDKFDTPSCGKRISVTTHAAIVTAQNVRAVSASVG